MSSGSLHIIEQLQEELAHLRQQAEYWEIMAMTDDLTGLHNRRLLTTIGQEFLERRKSSEKEEMTLLFIDLDDFGKLNKRYGDDVGDEALRVLAEGVRQNIRKTDIAIRKGGDEFVIILVGTGEVQVNEVVQSRIQKLLDGEMFFYVGDDKITVKGSVGVFSYETKASPFENIKKADYLMREQKQMRKKALKVSG